MKDFKVEIETVIQFAIGLTQLVGIFVVKPSLFDQYNHGAQFLAGDPGIYFMVLISVGFILFSLTYNKSIHTKFWVGGMLSAMVLFTYFIIDYNSNLREKTFLAVSATGPEPIRIIKGNNYSAELKKNCPLLISGMPVKELEVIQQCSNITDWNEIDKIWPKEEIESNSNRLLANYYFCLLLGGISLICGVQAIKCLRNKV
ncbi:hypothetical protein [Limnovirga soli]|uniref:Uncharacterized protein n=1 Tax=Limnovirga soli TaxID=2656915 RepID=A0A8J8FH32_9BACT|nr:hypothetical protein [Limnovirga soli]NNV57297.1 hypothetical protein [Limnovirga soli]